MSEAAVKIEFLVAGAGPAGAALASFLGQHGLKGMMIASAPGTADTPRAHIVNPFALECLRDIGLEGDCKRLATTGMSMQGHRWCHSVVGEEYGKVLAFGGHPSSLKDVALASPCDYLDLPQWHMEPLLVKYATSHGFGAHFNTELIEATRVDGGILCTLRGTTTGVTYKVKTKYLFGADGGRSTVSRAFPFEWDRKPSQGTATNVIIKMDIEHLMRNREAQLTWIMRPDSKFRKFGTSTCLRMVRPHSEWLVLTVAPGSNKSPMEGVSKDDPDIVGWIREIVGDDTVTPEIIRFDDWVIRETVATKFSNERDVFLLGDAAHRHPPAYGLGSNTCIADAYNLAWRVAFVHKGLAGPELLDSYTVERQPVGAQLVKEANEGLRDHMRVWEALGMLDVPDVGVQTIRELYQPTEIGNARRQFLHEALEGKRREGESLGIGGNQWYSSQAVYLDDEEGPRPTVDGDPIVKPLITTYPGNRLPHAWLDLSTRRTEISTQDIAGKGAFCLLTGIGGDAWQKAAAKISAETGIPINSYGIGFGLDYIDVYRQWHDVREIEDDGCLLVRPDRYVAWRAKSMVGDAEGKLRQVLNKVLAREK